MGSVKQISPVLRQSSVTVKIEWETLAENATVCEAFFIFVKNSFYYSLN